MSLFPVFLVPPIPFRKRQPSPGFRDVAVPAEPFRAPKADLTNERYLTGQTSRLRCARCAADLCPTSQIISKGFTGRHGRAYLVSASPVVIDDDDAAVSNDYPSKRNANKKKKKKTTTVSLPNTHTHKAMPRQLVTGAHTVSDISCAFCGSVIGWKYDSAEEETQRYKVGKYILETKKVFSSLCWENDHVVELDEADGDHVRNGRATAAADSQGWEDLVDFDSQDEDECEDLFAGVWSPALAIRRRQGKRFVRPPGE
ncbi:MAG: hypothetical protein Q9172_007195 [Xanthocarpia lactea]